MSLWWPNVYEFQTEYFIHKPMFVSCRSLDLVKSESPATTPLFNIPIEWDSDYSLIKILIFHMKMRRNGKCPLQVQWIMQNHQRIVASIRSTTTRRCLLLLANHWLFAPSSRHLIGGQFFADPRVWNSSPGSEWDSPQITINYSPGILNYTIRIIYLFGTTQAFGLRCCVHD